LHIVALIREKELLALIGKHRLDSLPVITTERLILRPPVAADFENWASFYADDESMRYIGGAQGRAEAWRTLCVFAGSWAIRGYGMFSLVDRETGNWIGRVGPWMPEGWPGTEVGWGIAREHLGKGFAHEAATAAIDWAFAELGWSEVIHTIHPDNRRSIPLAERLGSTNRGPTKLPFPSHEIRVDCYRQTKKDWLARRS
jgi:RimJ/RimL family protein N-acetyltransferase